MANLSLLTKNADAFEAQNCELKEDELDDGCSHPQVVFVV